LQEIGYTYFLAWKVPIYTKKSFAL
jgi:hypothetical protein